MRAPLDLLFCPPCGTQQTIPSINMLSNSDRAIGELLKLLPSLKNLDLNALAEDPVEWQRKTLGYTVDLDNDRIVVRPPLCPGLNSVCKAIWYKRPDQTLEEYALCEKCSTVSIINVEGLVPQYSADAYTCDGHQQWNTPSIPDSICIHRKVPPY